MPHIFHSVYHTPRMTELRHLYWAHGSAALAMGLAGLFVPIYLLTLGYPLEEITLFLLGFIIIALPTVSLSAYLVPRVNANWLMAAAEICISICFVMLLTLPWVEWPLWLMAIFRGVDRGLYWTAYHMCFSKARPKRQTGRAQGKMNAVVVLAHGAAPAVGGVIATEFGIAWVYGAAAGLMLTAASILVRSPDLVKHRPFNPRLLNARILRDLVANACYSAILMAETLLWPLFIFFIIPTYAGVGILSSVIVLSSAAVALIIGRRDDKRGPKRYLREGSWLMALVQGLRVFAQSVGHVFGINLLGGVSQSFMSTSFPARYYYHADREPRLEYIWAMENAHLVGWAILLVTFYILVSTLSPQTAMSIMLAACIPLMFGVRLIR